MSRFSVAVWKPLASKNPQPKMKKHDLIILHTMVGYLKSTDGMFRSGGFSGVESHFGVGGKWGSDAAAGLDGIVWQWGDTDQTADANLEANPRAISIETADNAPQSASDLAPWTDRQVTAIIKLVAALCKEHGIPAVLVPDSRSTSRGIAWHRQGIDPWRVSGGETWSNARGKECPGDARINQIHSVILPGVKALLNPTKPEVIDMQLTDKIELTAADARVLGDDYKEGQEVSVQWALRQGATTYARISKLEEDVSNKLKDLDAKLSAVLSALKTPTAVKK